MSARKKSSSSPLSARALAAAATAVAEVAAATRAVKLERDRERHRLKSLQIRRRAADEQEEARVSAAAVAAAAGVEIVMQQLPAKRGRPRVTVAPTSSLVSMSSALHLQAPTASSFDLPLLITPSLLPHHTVNQHRAASFALPPRHDDPQQLLQLQATVDALQRDRERESVDRQSESADRDAAVDALHRRHDAAIEQQQATVDALHRDRQSESVSHDAAVDALHRHHQAEIEQHRSSSVAVNQTLRNEQAAMIAALTATIAAQQTSIATSGGSCKAATAERDMMKIALDAANQEAAKKEARQKRTADAKYHEQRELRETTRSTSVELFDILTKLTRDPVPLAEVTKKLARMFELQQKVPSMPATEVTATMTEWWADQLERFNDAVGLPGAEPVALNTITVVALLEPLLVAATDPQCTDIRRCLINRLIGFRGLREYIGKRMVAFNALNAYARDKSRTLSAITFLKNVRDDALITTNRIVIILCALYGDLQLQLWNHTHPRVAFTEASSLAATAENKQLGAITARLYETGLAIAQAKGSKTGPQAIRCAQMAMQWCRHQKVYMQDAAAAEATAKTAAEVFHYPQSIVANLNKAVHALLDSADSAVASSLKMLAPPLGSDKKNAIVTSLLGKVGFSTIVEWPQLVAFMDAAIASSTDSEMKASWDTITQLYDAMNELRLAFTTPPTDQ